MLLAAVCTESGIRQTMIFRIPHAPSRRTPCSVVNVNVLCAVMGRGKNIFGHPMRLDVTSSFEATSLYDPSCDVAGNAATGESPER